MTVVDPQHPQFYTDAQGIITSDDPPFQVRLQSSYMPSVMYRDPVHADWITLRASKGLGPASMMGQIRPTSPIPIAITTRNLQRDVARSSLPPGMDVDSYAQLVQDRVRSALMWAGFQGIDFIGKGSPQPGLAYLNTSLYRWRLAFLLATIAFIVPVAVLAPALKGAAVIVYFCLVAAGTMVMRRRQRRQRQGPTS